MDIATVVTTGKSVFETIAHQMNPLAIVLLIFFLVSEYVGGNPRIKASAVYKVIFAVLSTLKDQLVPQAVQTQAAAVAAQVVQVATAAGAPAPTAAPTPAATT